jgi:hypothetical protein
MRWLQRSLRFAEEDVVDVGELPGYNRSTQRKAALIHVGSQ